MTSAFTKTFTEVKKFENHTQTATYETKHESTMWACFLSNLFMTSGNPNEWNVNMYKSMETQPDAQFSNLENSVWSPHAVVM